jgi:hypothetical protein
MYVLGMGTVALNLTSATPTTVLGVRVLIRFRPFLTDRISDPYGILLADLDLSLSVYCSGCIFWQRITAVEYQYTPSVWKYKMF